MILRFNKVNFLKSPKLYKKRYIMFHVKHYIFKKYCGKINILLKLCSI